MTNVDNPFESPVILSFCTGGRGLERGLERAVAELRRNKDRQDIEEKSIREKNNYGIRVASYVEIGSFECENLVQTMESGFLDPAPIWTNLKTFPAQGFRGKVHGIIGGYPCQPFSHAGNRGGGSDPRHLWPFIREHVRAVGPVWCFFENVEGHLTLGFPEVYKDLRDLGYKVEAGIFSAAEVGAPHQRKRLFILAIKEGATLGDSEYNGLYEPKVGRGINKASKRGKKGKSQSCEPTGAGGSKVGGDIQRSEIVLGDPSGLHVQGHEIRQGKGESGRTSDGENLADTNGMGAKRIGGEFSDATKANEGKTQQSERGWDKFIDSSEEPRWPSGYGQSQHEWEARRIVEPGLGCTVNGYNFREDLLRMYGNGVVEWTAKKAFLELLKKHIHPTGK